MEGKIAELRTLIEPDLQDDKAVQKWCTDSCLSRYLRSRDLDVNKAHKKLQHSVQWRKSYKPHEIRWRDVIEEGRTGKTYVHPNLDLEGRVMVILTPRKQNTTDPVLQVKYLVYCLEQASYQADRLGLEKMTWIVDFEGYSMSNAPPAKVSIQTLQILQSHYPERLGLALCYHPPWVFQITWRAVSPFIDPVTSQKIQFCKGKDEKAIMSRYFDMNKMETCLGGQSNKEFDFATYEQQQLAYEKQILETTIKDSHVGVNGIHAQV